MFALRESPDDVIEVLNIVPLQGSGGIVAPSCDAAISLAVDEINSGPGILGREVRVTTIDGGRTPREVAREVSALLATGMVHAITGWHISAVRRAVARAADGRVPYLYATTHEGLPDEMPGVLLIGEDPQGHVLAAMRWLRGQFGARRWAIIGNDYIWPRATAEAIHSALDPASIVLERFVPLGTGDFGDFLADARLDEADGVVMLLVGTDAAHFNRQFARTGRAARQVRVSPAVDETVLLSAGAAANDNLYVSSSFFPGRERLNRYRAMHGTFAPQLTYFGNTSYEAMHTLRAVASAAGTLDVPRIHAVLRDGAVLSTPSGERSFRDNQAVQSAQIARARGVDFDILGRIS
ncbi:ABC-type branched-subunit amino acid transport system substrate-binding protein [Nocardia transvalensis]|uniref:ABC-type branched-subunit amino acid transport system substrate-binding protein n=1 Tax=Nocardia transvalensis TaxID=37333 RepID=A0A7W9UHJ5_9NOCA|nr:substrate-binding domain-containing protein [Nocardia transvalensis]MBB5913172.1 ABC-type branched-subunit amino acid transport system substrate-binding protein [Nocardia transvalensis]